MLTQAVKQTLNDAALIAQRETWYARLQDMRDGARGIIRLNGIMVGAVNDELAYKEPELWVERALTELSERVHLCANDEVFVPCVVEYGVYGVHFTDKLFGANVYFKYDQWYSDELDIPIGSLAYPDLDNSELWQHCMRSAKAFMDAGVALPIYGLPTIASVLNVAINLFGERILVAMIDEPENALHDLRIINRLLCDMHRWYIDNIPANQMQCIVGAWRTQPAGCGQLCGCSNQLVSPRAYAEFIAPLDNELLGVYPHPGLIHLCGAHEQHIPAFRDMSNLAALQLNDRASVDLPLYLDGLRRDQVIYLNPCDDMTVETAIQLSGGERLIVVG